MKKFFKGLAVALTAGLVAVTAAACTQPHEHVFSTDWKMDAAQHWHECECGEMKDADVHHYGEWVVTKEATETETGTRTKTCTDCGFVYTETIPKLFVQWYVRGGMNEWKVVEDGKVPVEDGVGNLYIYLKNDVEFKIAANDWANEFNAATVKAADGVLAAKEGNIKVANTGWYSITIKDNNDVAKAECTIAPVQYYVRGDMNGWGTPDEAKVVVDQATMTAKVEIAIEAGQGFKVATADWKKEFNSETITAAEGVLSSKSGNINVAVTGTYVITIDLTAETVACTIAKK